MPAAVTALALVVSFAVLFALERAFPLRPATRPLRARLGVNLCLAVLAFAVAALTLRPLAAALLPWTRDYGVGLLAWLRLPVPVATALGFILLDLSFYYWHRANHRVGLLWRFHAAHHVDPDLDVTTAPRFHPGELVVSIGFRAVQIVALGVSPVTYLAYEAVFQLAVQFHHANLRLPLAVDRALRLLIVTPRMHGLHHSQRRDETHSNYGVVFSAWDRLHRSYRQREPAEAVAIGLPRFQDRADQRLGAVLAMPLTAGGDAFEPRRPAR